MLAIRSPEINTVLSGWAAAPVASITVTLSQSESSGLGPGGGGEEEKDGDDQGAVECQPLPNE